MNIRRIILTSILLILILKLFVIDICIVAGGSMTSTLFPNDLIVFVRKGLFFRKLKRLDIHVIRINNSKIGNSNRFLVKRLVGMPGENIDLGDSIIFINGSRIENPNSIKFNYSIPDSVISYEKLVNILSSGDLVGYCRYKSSFILNLSRTAKEKITQKLNLPPNILSLFEGQEFEESFTDKSYEMNIKILSKNNSLLSIADINTSDRMHPTNKGLIIPNKQYFYIGDNRPFSTDSRTLGCFANNMIKGKVLFVLFRKKNGRIEFFKSIR